MSYQKNTWIDHIVDPSTGDVVQQGTKFTATRANNFESGIEKAHQLVEGLAQNLLGSSVISGLTFTTNGLTANYTAGAAYVNGVKFDVAAGSIQLNATQGQYIYMDSDGAVKNTTSQATADAKCKLWYYATDASTVITSTDNRNIVSKDSFVKQAEVAANGANKIPRLDAQGKGAFSITGDAATIGGKATSDIVLQTEVAANGANKVPRLDATGKGAFSITGDAATVAGKTVGNASGNVPLSNGTVNTNLNADMVDGFHVGSGANQIPTRDAAGKLNADLVQGQDVIPKLSDYRKYRSGKDAKGIFTVVEYKRTTDGSLYKRSTLSNLDAAGNYLVRTEQYYKADGVTLEKTIIFDVVYDADGDWKDEVPR